MIKSKTQIGEGVQLKPYNSKHYAQTVAWLNSPIIRQTFGITYQVTVDSHRQWLENNPDVRIWAIYEQTYIGNIQLTFQKRHHSAYMQIYIGDLDCHSKGIGYRALSLLFDEVFKNSTHRVWLHCFEDNERALGLYSKLGFKSEGLERDSIFTDGQYISQMRLSLLQHEWESRS